jgi:hypothetical protein
VANCFSVLVRKRCGLLALFVAGRCINSYLFDSGTILGEGLRRAVDAATALCSKFGTKRLFSLPANDSVQCCLPVWVWREL